jgi:hypothetical protein
MSIPLRPEQRDLQASPSEGAKKECYGRGARLARPWARCPRAGLAGEIGPRSRSVLKLPSEEIRRTVTRTHQDVRAGFEYKRPGREESLKSGEGLSHGTTSSDR